MAGIGAKPSDGFDVKRPVKPAKNRSVGNSARL